MDLALYVFYGTLPLLGVVVLAAWQTDVRLRAMCKWLDDRNASLRKQLDEMDLREEIKILMSSAASDRS